MMAWYLSEQFKSALSKEKLFKYGLAHDLVEVYAGDTPAFVKSNMSTNTHETKRERELRALVKIKKEFGYFTDLIETIESYEEMKDDESVFIYELDKIIPALNAYLDDGYGWNKFNITLEEIALEKRKKVTKVKELVDLLEEMLERFEEESGRLFKITIR
jgi:putative hydrolase of HD superfamily